MPFRVRCPRCGQTAEIAEEHLGRQGQCNNCGTLVAIPARLSKVCFVCGVDLTHIPHVKDGNSNYICTSCHESRQAAASSASGRVECSICHVHFPREQSAGSTEVSVCPDCATIIQAQRLPVAIPVSNAATAVADASPRQQHTRPLPRPPLPEFPSTARNPDRLPLILSSIALAGVIILAILHFASRPQTQPLLPDNPDQETLTRVLILKSQAEVLLEVGKQKEAIEKYDALLRIPSTPAIAAELESAKSAREKVVKQLASSSTPESTTISEQKKNGAIFNE